MALRAALFAAGPLQIAWMLLHAPSDYRYPYETLCAAGVLAMLAPLYARRLGPRSVEVRLGEGEITLAGRWIRRRVRAREIAAIHVARGAEGTSLALARKKGPPLFLELADERSAEAVASALRTAETAGDLRVPARAGGMFGELGFPRGISPRDAIEALLRIAGAAAWIALYVSLGEGPKEARFGIAAGIAMYAALALRAARPFLRPKLAVVGGAIHVGKRAVVAAERVASARVTRAGVAIALAAEGDAPARSIRVGLPGCTAAEREHVAAHLVAAARAAAGGEEHLPEAAASIASLRRGEGESARAWLTRLDDLGKGRDADPYRRAPLDRAELWAAAGDEAAPQDLRAAAARVLLRIDPGEARERVRAIGKQAPPDARRRLRIALRDDLDGAAEAYEALPPPFRAL
jgi:hypothetical protein